MSDKNKRLNNGDRDRINRFAKQQVQATEDRTAFDAAYEAAADAIHAVVIAEHPQKDMQVLAKYDCAAPDACIYVSTGGYNYERFAYREGDKRIILRPSGDSCRRQPILLRDDAEKVFDAYLAAKKELEDARKARLKDFSALIYNTPSFNALAEAWPAVETLRGEVIGVANALSVLSEEVIDRLRNDAAFMAAAA